MGWKSTVTISRTEAKRLIIERIISLDNLSDTELEDMLEMLGYGETMGLEYYGYNFRISEE